jgi:hypothetical protein
MLSKFHGPYQDLTFFANRRDFFVPTAGIGYQVNRMVGLNLTMQYFVQDLFNSGALDSQGNIVGPIMIYPYILNVGVDIRFGKAG